jgi:manganese/zinc/iron transport system substrate-binding protein
LRVETTTNFLDDTVRQVGGVHVQTTRLMDAGVDPHLYQAKASDLDAMRGADAVFAVGLYLEASLEHTLRDVSGKPVLFAGEQIPRDQLLNPPPGAAPEEEHDPHVWFDPRLWAHVVDAVAEQLIELDPDNAGDYSEQAERFRGEVLALADEISATLEQIPPDRRTLVTSHDAFRYFGRAFDLDVVAIQGISTEQEAATADVARVADAVADSGVRSVFVESSVSDQTLRAVVAAVAHRGGEVEIGGELHTDSARDARTPEGTYLGMLRANADTLVAGLS